MKFDVDPKIFSFFPGMHLVVAVPETLTNSDSEGLVSAYWNQAWIAAEIWTSQMRSLILMCGSFGSSFRELVFRTRNFQLRLKLFCVVH